MSKEPLKKTKVLDLGYVELWSVMGDDSTVADAARTSYSSAQKRTNDRNLLRYMWANGHSSPFEQVIFQFKWKLPIFIARQVVRHRTARLNEMSGRYSELPEEYYMYSEQGLALQSTTNKQGSEDMGLEDEQEFLDILEEHNKAGFSIYKKLVEAGCSLELARCHLPLSTYTEWVWQMDLHNLLHFLNLRMDSHAQAEVRAYAQAIYEMIKEYVPITCEAFEDYNLHAMKLSRMEIDALVAIINNRENQEIPLADYGLSKREQVAFVEKLKRLNYDLIYPVHKHEEQG